MKTKEKQGSRSRASRFFFDDGVDSRKQCGVATPRLNPVLHEAGLCHQVKEVLSLIFGGASNDQRLWDLAVLSVEPVQGGSRLLVKVYPLPLDCPRTVSGIHAVLKSARPFLRSEVAQAINRRKAPELTFAVVPGPERSNDHDR